MARGFRVRVFFCRAVRTYLGNMQLTSVGLVSVCPEP